MRRSAAISVPVVVIASIHTGQYCMLMPAYSLWRTLPSAGLVKMP